VDAYVRRDLKTLGRIMYSAGKQAVARARNVIWRRRCSGMREMRAASLIIGDQLIRRDVRRADDPLARAVLIKREVPFYANGEEIRGKTRNRGAARAIFHRSSAHIYRRNAHARRVFRVFLTNRR